jgi:hypothetical protein
MDTEVETGVGVAADNDGVNGAICGLVMVLDCPAAGDTGVTPLPLAPSLKRIPMPNRATVVPLPAYATPAFNTMPLSVV